MQTIEYQGEATIAVDLVLAGLLADMWSPGDWFIEVYVTEYNDEGDSADEVIAGDLIEFTLSEGHGGVATVHPKNPETGLWTSEPVEVNTENIVKLVIP